MAHIQYRSRPGSPSNSMQSHGKAETRGKKRKLSSVKVPEAEQIFKGLNFFFFPNTTVNQARRMRIMKAIEYGATWIENWGDTATHIIADRNISFQELSKFLRNPSISAHVVIVNETYPSDCISYRSLLDPKQKLYEIAGIQERACAAPSSDSHKASEQASSPSTGPCSPSAAALEPSASISGTDYPQSTGGSTCIASQSDRTDPNRTDREQLQPKHNANPPIAAHGEIHIFPRPSDHSISGCSNWQSRSFPLQSLPTSVPKLPAKYDDALTLAVAEVKKFEDIPLELEDKDSENEHVAEAMDEYSSNDEAQTRSKRSRKILQENFRCMEKNDGSMKAGNPNARTIEVLEQMGHYYDRVGDHWRTIAYRKAVAVLRKQSVKIITKEDALRLPCVGERLAEKIEEIVWTNKLRRLDNALIDPADQLLQLFMQIYGVGFSQASRWVTAGFKSLDDLRNNVKLTDNQKIGIAHFDDFRTRIPRAEVKEHGRIVSEALRNVDSAFEVTIGGSYRRGATDSGDIDLIITKPGADITFIRTVVLDTLVPMLFEQNFLQAALAKTDKETGTKWHGASALPGSKVWRRIDLLLVPWYELGAALIYFTGNDIFNRSIRLLASKKGMRLNQHGLYRDVLRDKGRQKITDGELVEGRSERKIFEILGVPWRPPEHRIC